MNLTGYQSSSRRERIAMLFAFLKLQEGEIPVIFQINFTGDKGLFEMSKGYSVFPSEDEVLVQDGLEYRVLENKEVTVHETDHKYAGKKYQLIVLQYPVGKDSNNLITSSTSSSVNIENVQGINDTI